MKLPRRRFLYLAAGAAELPAVSRFAWAQTYPTRPIRLVAGFAAGTAADIIARILGDKLASALGKPVLIENITGASGNLAGDRVAKADPDGHSLILAANSAVVINPSLYAKMSYNPLTDLIPITQVCSYANILFVNKDVPASSPQELAALARARPGGLTYGSPGVGTTIHLSGELFASMAGIDIRHIPFRSASLLPDLIAGRITMAFLPPSGGALPASRDGSLKALAVTSLWRIAVAPNIPTMDQTGFPGFDITVWFGLMAPAKTPSAIIERLHRETVKILARPELRKRFEELGLDAIGNSPQEFASAIGSEAPRWAKFIQQIGAKLN
jgi:tripartite-type tricarboxylate transporter receptor subunit TctC